MPEQTTVAGISHCAAVTVPVRTVAFLRVRPNAHVHLLLMAEGPGSIVRPSDLQVPPRPPSTPPGFVAYLDGSSDVGLVGCGFAIVTGGNGINDTNATCVNEAHTARWSPTPITRHISVPMPSLKNTAELTALGETLRNLIAQADTLTSGRGII